MAQPTPPPTTAHASSAPPARWPCPAGPQSPAGRRPLRGVSSCMVVSADHLEDDGDGARLRGHSPAMVRGMRSPFSSTRRMMNWPAFGLFCHKRSFDLQQSDSGVQHFFTNDFEQKSHSRFKGDMKIFDVPCYARKILSQRWIKCKEIVKKLTYLKDICQSPF